MEMKATTGIQGKTAVATEIDGYSIVTEPPMSAGGTGEFPPASRMVVAALLNCSFSTVKNFCDKREIDTQGMSMDFSGNFEEGAYTDMRFDLQLPSGFPEKYKESIGRVFEACTVKKIMKNLPEIQIHVHE